MIDVTIPVIHKTGINTPVEAMIVKAVIFIMIPSLFPFFAFGTGLAMAHG